MEICVSYRVQSNEYIELHSIVVGGSPECVTYIGIIVIEVRHMTI